jgi:cytochrome c peroxidase
MTAGDGFRRGIVLQGRWGGILIAGWVLSSVVTDQPALPVDTLPPTAALLRQAPLNGFSRLPSHPDENPLSAARVALGRRLFFDPILSRDGQVSCASCHQPEHGLASPDPVAIGTQGRRGRRNAPSLFNRGYGQTFFWDGRATTLEEQSLLPISNPDEMGDDLDLILARLAARADYAAQFAEAFDDADPAAADSTVPAREPRDAGSAVGGEAAVTAQRLAYALAAFQRTLLLGDSAVDRFRSADVAALSLEARQGLWIFESRGRCWQCHSGENFSDESFHNTGVGFGLAERDLGRFVVTQQTEDRFKFKTPTLRGLVQTAPYMHDGSQATLEEVVEFYDRGGSPNDPERTPLLEPLRLSPEEKRHLVAFLRALSPE